jgi:maltose alpha-D-glucosyltransferase/alpha-amylase
VTFLRNTTSSTCPLTEGQRAEVFEAFAPRSGCGCTGGHPAPAGADARRGQQRIQLAYALQFALPGTPAIRYGEEIGWGTTSTCTAGTPSARRCSGSPRDGAGFSTADADRLVRPLVATSSSGIAP